MPLCPQCQKPLAELLPNCPYCKADLDLLVDYVASLQTGLRQAERMVRAGELDLAVWAYLEVLETDPDNPEAKRQVSRIATAVRAFDRLAPGRRWLGEMRGETDDGLGRVARWMRAALIVLLLVMAFAAGYAAGSGATEEPSQPRQGPPQEFRKSPPQHKGLGDRGAAL